MDSGAALRAPRGVVFDRDGRVLVENRHSYSISIVREHTKDLNRTIRLRPYSNQSANNPSPPASASQGQGFGAADSTVVPRRIPRAALVGGRHAVSPTSGSVNE